MKKAYTSDLIATEVKALDVRAQQLTTEEVNRVIDDGYTELCTIVQAFGDEEVVSLVDFYDAGETTITLDVDADVVDVYDLYLTTEGLDKNTFDYGIEKTRDDRIVYRDNRYNGRVHIDLTTTASHRTSSGNYDNVVIKYYYIPTNTTDTVYMDAQTWLAFKSALGVALYNTLHDVERNGQKRAEMNRQAKAIIPSQPEDSKDPSHGHIFFGLDV